MTTVTGQLDARRDELSKWLREHGFTEDRSGWFLRDHVRVTLPAPNKIRVYVYIRATHESWTAHLDDAPPKAMRAVLAAAGIAVSP